MDATIALPASPARSPLWGRNFTALWAGQLVSTLGDRLHQIALLVLVGSLTANDLGQIGLLFVTIGLPALLFGPLAGALADRWDCRGVMLAADLARVPLVLAIPALARADLRWVYALTFLLTTAGLFFKPAKGAIIPQLVPADRLTRANAVAAVTDSAMDVLGYPLAAALIAGLTGLAAGGRGVELAFYVDAGTYLFSAAMIALLAVPHARRAGAGPGSDGLGRLLVEGTRVLRANATLLANTVVATVVVFVAFGSWTLAYGYAVEVTGTGAAGYALLEAAMGAGAVVGGLLVGRWGDRLPKGPAILAGVITMGLTDAALAAVADVRLAAGLLALGGAGNMLFVIPSVTLVQEATPPACLGRVLGLRDTLLTLAFVVANALAGLGAARFGVQAMYALNGGLLVAVGTLAFLAPSARDAR